MRFEPEKLYEIATEARQAFEAKTIARPLLAKLYLEYNPDVEIDSFLEQAETLFPHLNCGLTTVYLRHTIGAGTVRQGVYKHQKHTNLLIATTTIDITADQYGGPPVYVGSLQFPWPA